MRGEAVLRGFQFLTVIYISRVIRALTDRVEKEHSQHLRDAQRVEDRSALANSSVLNLSSDNTDFAKLVGAGTVRSPSTNSVTSTSNGNSLDDVWGRILDDEVRSMVLSAFTEVLT